MRVDNKPAETGREVDSSIPVGRLPKSILDRVEEIVEPVGGFADSLEDIEAVIFFLKGTHPKGSGQKLKSVPSE